MRIYIIELLLKLFSLQKRKYIILTQESHMIGSFVHKKVIPFKGEKEKTKALKEIEKFIKENLTDFYFDKFESEYQHKNVEIKSILHIWQYTHSVILEQDPSSIKFDKKNKINFYPSSGQ
jgi:hypothetical protein